MSPNATFEMGCWTAVSDYVIEKLGTNAALVLGRIMRYCDKNGYCNASFETIGNSLGLSRPTIQKHLNILVEEGYLSVESGQVKHKTNIYHDTGKMVMIYSMDMVLKSDTPTGGGMDEAFDTGEGTSKESLLASVKKTQEARKEALRDDTINKIQLKKQNNTPVPPASKAALFPETLGGKKLMGLLSQEQAANGHRPVTRFQTTTQKLDFEAAEAKLGTEELTKALAKGLRQGIIGRAQMVNYICAWAANLKKKSAVISTAEVDCWDVFFRDNPGVNIPGAPRPNPYPKRVIERNLPKEASLKEGDEP